MRVRRLKWHGGPWALGGYGLDAGPDDLVDHVWIEQEVEHGAPGSDDTAELPGSAQQHRAFPGIEAVGENKSCRGILSRTRLRAPVPSIGVQIASRPGRFRFSPIPISSP